MAILALLGVPLWLCALGIFMLFLQNRRLRKRPGNTPARVRPASKERWRCGHGVWVSDVFAFRQSPAAWTEALLWLTDACLRLADEEEQRHLHRLGVLRIGDNPVIASMALGGGATLDVAARPEHRAALLGPFASSTERA